MATTIMTNMMKVWVLHHGDYEDHEALAIVATQEEADQVCRDNNKDKGDGPPDHHREWLFQTPMIIGDISGLR